MPNKHQFQQDAKSFRAGRISLQQFTDKVFAGEETSIPQSTLDSSLRESAAGETIPKFPNRRDDAHKGDLGRVLLIGGSQGMGGAIGLSSMAALRTGSGLVKTAVPACAQSTVASFSPCLMTIGCDDRDGGFGENADEKIEPELDWADVIAIGPGMGTGPAQSHLVAKLYSDLDKPMVVDADGLNGLAEAKIDLSVHAGPRILTPHPGEFARLINARSADGTEASATDAREKLEQAAIELARDCNLILVLKGHRTLVTDGNVSYRNSTGNPGMATGGSGDVLTGMIASLIGQRLSPLDATKLGVYLHGLAGDAAAKSIGQASMLATDIIEHLSNATRAIC